MATYTVHTRRWVAQCYVDISGTITHADLPLAWAIGSSDSALLDLAQRHGWQVYAQDPIMVSTMYALTMFNCLPKGQYQRSWYRRRVCRDREHMSRATEELYFAAQPAR